jgi:hypothetical protein
MRWFAPLLAALLLTSTALAQPEDVNDEPARAEGDDWEIGGEQAGGSGERAAPSDAPEERAEPAPTVVVTSPEPPKVVLPPGGKTKVEPRCGDRAGAPLVIECASCAEPPAAEAPEMRRIWYGWQTLIADLGTMSLFLVAANDSKRPPAELYLAAATAGAPIIHFAHRNGKRGAISLAIRAGSLAALAALAAPNDSRGWRDDDLMAMTAAYLLLVHLPMTAIDAAVLGRKYVPVEQPAAFKPKLVGVSPLVVRSDHVATRGPDTFGAALSGTF